MKKKSLSFSPCRKEEEEIRAFLLFEEGSLEDYLAYVKMTGREIPDDAYRGIAFIGNRTYREKPGSLSLLLMTHRDLIRDGPEIRQETIIEATEFRYGLYTRILETGGYL